MSQDTADGPHDAVPTAASAPAAAVPNPWRTFSLLALIEFIVILDASIVNIALPSIQRDLDFTPTGLAWVVDAYLLAFGGFLLLGGRAADIVGRRRLFLLGLAVFTVASLTNTLATADWHLVVSRAGQGLGAAMVVPAAIALITDLFGEQNDRSKALGIFNGMGGVAAAIGVVAGGLLTSISWHWIFLINIPVGAAVILLGLRMLPSGRPQGADGIDVPGAVSGTGGLFLLILAVIRGGELGWTSAATQTVFAIAAVLLVVFVLRQRFAAAPMIPTILLRRRDLVLGNATMVLVATVMFGTFFIITLYLQQVRALAPHEAGLTYLPIPIGTFIGTQLAPRLARRLGPHNALAVALLIQVAGLSWWAASIEPGANVFAAFLAPAVLWGVGAGSAIVSTFIVCTMGVSGPLAGAASGMASTSQNAGGAMGLAGLVTVADARTETVHGTVGDLDALTAGYALALWCGVGLAVLGALLTRGMKPAADRAATG